MGVSQGSCGLGACNPEYLQSSDVYPFTTGSDPKNGTGTLGRALECRPLRSGR